MPYFLAKYIPEDTLYLTRKDDSPRRPPPRHVVVKEIAFKDNLTPAGLRDALQAPPSLRRFSRIRLNLRLVATMRSVVFLIKSIPALIAFRPHIVACHQSVTILHGIFAKYVLGSKFALHIHNNSEIAVMQNLRLLRGLVRKADRIFCLTPSMAELLCGVVPSAAWKVRCTSTGVDPLLFRNTGRPREKQIIAIGRLSPAKGYLHLLDAVSEVFQRYPDYKLIIVGEGPERKRMQKQIRDAGLSRKVRFTGALPQERVAELLNRSRVFVMSSVTEGLPKALLEALSCGTPAVVTTACNADTIVRGRGIVVQSGSPHAMSDAIMKMISDRVYWETCSINCTTVRQEFSWETVAGLLRRDYEALLHDRRHRMSGALRSGPLADVKCHQRGCSG